MADLSKFGGLLKQMGILSPSEKAQMQYQQQMEQLQASMAMRAQNLQAGQLGTSLGFPVYLMEQALRGGGPNASFNIPGIPAPEDTSRQEQVIGGVMGNDLPSQGGISGNLPQQPMKYSQQLMMMAKKMLDLGDTNRASLLQQMAVTAAQDEEEAARKQAEMTKPEGMGTVGVEGQPDFRQQQYREYNPLTGKYEIKNQGPTYRVGSQDVNVNLDGELLTGPRQEAKIAEFSELTENTLNFFTSATPVYDLLGQGASAGITGELMTKLDNALATARTSMSLIADDEPRIREMVDTEFSNTSKWKNIVGKTQLSQSALVGLAYTLAASYNKDGRISDNDMRKALEEIGGNLSDPASARRVLRQAVLRSGQRYKNAYRALPDSALKAKLKDQYEDTIGDFARFEKDSVEVPAASAEDKKPNTMSQEDWDELQALRKELGGL